MDQDVKDMLHNTCVKYNWTYEEHGKEVHIIATHAKSFLYKKTVMASAKRAVQELLEIERKYNVTNIQNMEEKGQ